MRRLLAPALVLEVVSDAYDKDYTAEEMPKRYQELGVRELVRYDPDWSAHPRSTVQRRLLSHFVRNEQGVLEERAVQEQAVRLQSHPLWLLHRPPYYLRVATGEAQDKLVLWPTGDERARYEAERARLAMERPL